MRKGCLNALVASVSCFLCSIALAQELPQNWQSLSLYELSRATKAAQLTPEQTAETFVGWMAANDWQSMQLELHDLYNLYSLINIDSVDRRHFSARWTGVLTAPATGGYTLAQVRQYSGTDCRLKILINGNVVLDSTQRLENGLQYSSQPIELVAGQAIPIEVQLTHNITRIDYSEGAPMVVLTWKVGENKPSIIPTTAFAPPTGFGQAGAHGLKGEYFSNLDRTGLQLTRLDPALDIVSSWPPIAPRYQEQASAVFNACKEKLLDPNFLSQAAAEHKDNVFSHTMWRVAYRMNATDRVRLVRLLTQKPDVLRAMSLEAMGRLMEAVYMLPGDEQIELLGEWALARPQPRCEPGPFPGWGEGYYQQLNTDYYWLVGHLLQGPYWNDAESLWTNYGVRDNGECNLAVAYIVAYATREESFDRDGRHVAYFYSRLQEHLDDEAVVGDKRVSWLIARAYAEEVMTGATPEILNAPTYLDEARLVAESPEHEFWALQETAARLASLGEVQRLNELLGQRQGETPDQQTAITSWREKANAIAAANAEQREAEQGKSQSALIDELKRRLADAQERSDQTEIDRYARAIERMESEENE